MKKLTLFLFLLFTLSITAQNNLPINGFWGLEFGESKATAKKKIKSTINGEDENSIFTRDVSFGGNSYDICLISFFENKLYHGIFSKNIQSIDDGIDFINSLAEKISTKYGTPEIYDDDVSKTFLWTDVDNNTIMLGIRPQETRGYRISILYNQDAISKAKKESELNDF